MAGEKRPVDILSAEINIKPGTRRDSVWRRMASFSPGVNTAAQRDTKTDLHATCYSLVPAANLLLWQVASPTATWRTFQT